MRQSVEKGVDAQRVTRGPERGEEGRVVAEGTHEELLNSVPLYNEVLAQTVEAD